MNERLSVLIADDEIPARYLLSTMLATFDDVELIAEVEDGLQALRTIERLRPDLALLDLQMPELDGLEVVRLLKKKSMPLVAFVTGHAEYAAQAFELNAVDYLLKPIDPARLRDCLDRAWERLDRSELPALAHKKSVRTAVREVEAANPKSLRRIPVRLRDEVIFLSVDSIAVAVARGELLYLTTITNETHIIYYRLRDLEARLGPQEFLRISRGSLVNVSLITKVTPLPRGIYRVFLSNGMELVTSRLQSKVLREKLLRL
jgi:DNA-binding LytR/AlgR family response regulator